jgi:drug/metabolite transporter (DMT)-like permease
MLLLGKYVIKHGRAVLLTLLQFIATGLVFTAIGLLTEPLSWTVLMHSIPALLITSVFATATPYLLQAIAQKHTSACDASIIVCAEALFGALGGIFYLGEALSLETGVGAALLSAGILGTQVSRGPKKLAS